jgi:ketosteroid isomerase-like protein
MSEAMSSHAGEETAEVVALDREASRAFVDRDLARLDALFSDSLLVNSPILRVNDKRTVLELLGRGVISHHSVEVEVEAVRSHGDTVVVMGAETVRDTPDSAVLRRRYTNVWRREGNTWRLFIRHANIVVGQGPA